MKISPEHLTLVCKPGKGAECCSFLIRPPGGFECGKRTPFEQALTLRRMSGAMKAMGDNCEGWWSDQD